MSTTPQRRVLVAAIGLPCAYCAEAMTVPDRPPSRDHIKPRSKGHALAGNLAPVCCRCNTDKGSLSLGQWLTRLSRAGDARADHVAAFVERGLAT
jgi:5-methylcytosine-specific restriction endonuclease McrA